MNQKITVTIDRKGSVEVHGLVHGDDDAPRVAGELGLADYYHLGIMHTGIRTDGLTPEQVGAARRGATERGYAISEVDVLPPQTPTAEAGHEHDLGASTIEVLHTHAHGPSKKEKAVYPFLVLGVVAILAGVAWVSWDHKNHAYRKVLELNQLAAVRAEADLEQGGLAKLVNPDDSRYASVEVRSWSWWLGKTAIAHDSYVRIPDLPAESVEDFVKARGSLVLTFKVDTSIGEDPAFHVERVDRGGMDSGIGGFTMEIHPFKVGTEPQITARREGAGYFDGKGIAHDRTDTFQGASRIRMEGFVQETEKGFRIRTDGYAVALAEPIDPPVRVMLHDFAVTDEDMTALQGPLAAKKQLLAKRLVVFVALQSEFPWTEEGRPGRRQLAQEIGEAELHGFKVGKVYVENGARREAPSA